MLSDVQLIVEVRKLAGKGQKLPVLLLLAHVPQPAKTGVITAKAADIGFKTIAKWNVTDILSAADRAYLVARLPQGWTLLDAGMEELHRAGVNLTVKRTSAPSDSILPRELFENTRGYLEKVVRQINGSYDHEFYDCCAVMCRRLVETLIIEAYEAQGRAERLKGKDGNFHMLNGLLGVLMKDPAFNLGRNSIKGFETLKAIGDKAAHTRTFNARKTDIDPLRGDLRAGVEELLHLAKLI